MKISPLQQALCADRSQLTGGPDPNDWITPALPTGWRLLSFHFFVDWSQPAPQLGRRVWMTRLVHLAGCCPEFAALEEQLLRCFSDSSDYQYFTDLEQVCRVYDDNVSVILLPEMPVRDVTWSTPAWVVGRRAVSAGLRIRRASIHDMAEAIKRHSGGPVRVGNKGLKFGTSAIECFLSTSDAAFPGDADGVIVDDQNRVRCVVEYKKHTLSDELGNHLMPRYYPRPDGRKYQRLAALAAHYSALNRARVPMVVLYYSTRKPVIRLQEIGSLDSQRVFISRDSGDLVICNAAPRETSEEVVRWLELYS